MNASLALSAHTDYLSDDDQRTLISAAQDVPTAVETDEQGERVVYGTTPAADRALTALTEAFLPVIHKVARTSKVLDFEDALAVCLEEFVTSVRRYNLSSGLPFAATISTILRFRISDTDRTSDLIVVRENVAARYWQLVHKHDGDVLAAYEECRTTSNGFAPATFLAVHYAIASLDSLDGTSGDSDRAEGQNHTHEAALADPSPSPEDLALNADLVRWLFTLVPDREEQILRLRFGFSDLATENLRLAAGFRADVSDLVMSDKEVAQVLGSTTPTVNRLKRRALDTMRAAMEEVVADEHEAEAEAA